MKTVTEWQFGGWMQGASPTAGWMLLGAALLMGLVMTYVAYRGTLRELPRGPRWLLSALRGVFCLGLIFCLANPSRVERKLLDDPGKQPLAVVVDRSESMTLKDNRGRSRLDGALRTWEKIRPDAEKHFSEIKYSSFAKELVPSASLESALSARHDAGETLMFNSLDAVLSSAPPRGFGGILCVTDGLETSSTASAALVSRAISSRTPLYFLIGENRLRSREYMQIHDVIVPTQALRRTQFNYQAVIDAYAEQDQDLPVSLSVGGREIVKEVLKLRKGSNVLSWTKSVDAGEPGTMRIEMRAGTGNRQKLAVNAVRVTEKIGVNVLYYQGALDWGFHYLNRIFQRDPSFTVTALFNPALGTKLRRGSAASGAGVRPPIDLPNNPQQLAKYQLVLLDNVFVNQLSKLQQQALIEYARHGGGLLFILPNEKSAQAFAGSKLEEMLPVVFEPPGADADHHDAAELFQLAIRGTRAGADPQDPETVAKALTPFAFSPRSRLSEVFTIHGPNGDEKIVPMFADYVAVKRAKPAAEVLAYHPNAKNPATGEQRILLATQTFGNGRSSVLSTDSLWRWRMTLPSDSRSPATFWQQLVLWLAQSSSADGIRFVETSTEALVDQPASLTLLLTAGGAPEVTAVGPDKEPVKVDVQPGVEAGQWHLSWTPKKIGLWELTARAGLAYEGHRFLNIVPKGEAARDRADLPPDFERMRELAAATGGEVIQNSTPAFWLTPTEITGGQELSVRRQLLWNRWWLLAACLGPYASELMLRRRWKLL